MIRYLWNERVRNSNNPNLTSLIAITNLGIFATSILLKFFCSVTLEELADFSDATFKRNIQLEIESVEYTGNKGQELLEYWTDNNKYTFEFGEVAHILDLTSMKMVFAEFNHFLNLLFLEQTEIFKETADFKMEYTVKITDSNFDAPINSKSYDELLEQLAHKTRE